MSSQDLATLQATIDQWPDVSLPPDGQHLSDACRRALDALPGLIDGTSGWIDVTSLLRQVLLTSEVTYGGMPSLRVPTTDSWPTVDQWRDVACAAVPTPGDRIRITASDWAPPSSVAGYGIGDDLAREQVREVYRDRDRVWQNELPPDPFWATAHQGFGAYRGEPQRQAARAAVLSDGNSVVIALPTGRGKTAVAWSKTLLSYTGVTVVIVPTVVLALDMERRTIEVERELKRSLSPVKRFAYVGAMDPEVKKHLRAAVRIGAQRIIYTSPEAFVSGLSGAVAQAARDGNLQQIIIDEAHLVDQWGSDFRPEFQTMPGLIRDAYAQAPETQKPSVLLLSATLAQRAVDVLTRLFQVGDRPVDLVWGSEVRVEPTYFFGRHKTEDARVAAVLEAVKRLPRPLILYTTKVEDAEQWAARLRQAGLRRVDAITGKSSDEVRRTVMQRWRGEATNGGAVATTLDVVVGTSAFGLGLDMPNVRTVLHACLPETIDRYYQEVGRGGRDGRPSVAYLAQAPDDLEIAVSLNNVTMIGDELGWKRWESMRQSAEVVGHFRYRIRKDILPPYLDVGYKRSALWNVRTLTLLAQAGVIDMRAPRLTLAPGLSEEEKEARREEFYAQAESFIEFELRDGRLLEENSWKAAVREVRSAVRAAQSAALTSLRHATEGGSCVGRTIAHHYKVRVHNGVLLTNAACRGCPSCRRDPSGSPGIHPLEPSPPLPWPDPSRDRLAHWRSGASFVFIHYSPGENLSALFTRMAERHLRVWRVSREIAERLQRDVGKVPIVHDDPDASSSLLDLYAGPVAVVLTAPEVPSDVWARIGSGLPTYLIGPAGTMNPDRPGTRLQDAADGPCVSARTLLKGM
ncbi:protein DpdF [Kribbella catacumbae]|uniref:protein DpdF n=1 Tax=Kribbella catacumbae TaxID=460086 RepID=UPI0003647DC8|nr:protein DpdF [Kribbella catacumbae]